MKIKKKGPVLIGRFRVASNNECYLAAAYFWDQVRRFADYCAREGLDG